MHEDANSPQDLVHLSRAERREQGKAYRKECPRGSHADVVLGQGPRDPVALIEHSNGGRIEDLLPVRFGRMSESAFAFFRGTANVQAHDLKGTPSSGIIVQCCGDCHLMNFGGFATPERKLVFDINDFDETFPAPFEWDVKRLAASFAIAARWLEFDAKECEAAARNVVQAYREEVHRYADMPVLDVWYSQISSDHWQRQYGEDEEFGKRLKKVISRAQQNNSERVFHKLTTEENGRVRIIDQPPLIYHIDPSRMDVQEELLPFFQSYRDSLPPDRRKIFERFRLTDFVYKVVGVGSVGTWCFVALYMADGDPLFLQVKQARASVLEGLAGPPHHAHNGERIVEGQRLMQCASDIFLGWSRGPRGRDFYVRQLRDMKVSAELAGFTPRWLSYYGTMCGDALARAHSKAGDAATIAGYLGSGASFDEAIAEYAIKYADQVDDDFTKFQAATRAGRLPIDTLPQELEQALR